MLHSPDNTAASVLLRCSSENDSSVTCTLVVEGRTFVPHARIAPFGDSEAALHCPFGAGFEGTTSMTPATGFLPVSVFAVRSLTRERVRIPLSDIEQPQHSFITWFENTYTIAHRFPDVRPGLTS